MAVGATSLRFVVEIAADQATEGLRAIQVAANQAGVSIKQSLTGVGTAAQRANSGLLDLRRGMGQGRQAALFFGRALGDLAPAGSAAQAAISGIGGALFATTAAMSGLLLAMEGLRFAINYFQQLEKEAKAAAAAVVTAERTLRSEAAETAAVQAEARGDKLLAAQIRARAELNRLNEDAARLEKDLSAAKEELADRTDDMIRVLPKEEALENRIKSLTAELATVETKRVRVAAELGIKIRELTEGLAEYNKELGKSIGLNKELEIIQRPGDGNFRRGFLGETQLKQAAAVTNVPEIINIQRFLDDLKAADDAAKETAERIQKTWQAAALAIADTWTQAFAVMVSGQGNAAVAMLRAIIQSIRVAAQAYIVQAQLQAAATNAWNPVAALAAVSIITGIMEGLVARIPARAMGGPVRPDQPYVVGERGPELMVPNRTGTIVPNDALGSTTFNIYALDAASFEGFLRRRGRTLARGMRDATRRRLT